MRSRAARTKEFTVYVVPAWKWKEFIAFELIGGTAFYLVCRKIAHSELFGIAANIALPQMLKYIMSSYRKQAKDAPQPPPS
ncbi:hypothetical protein [Paenibacillus harenae]|uniref:hypothetical protein n=1 Tax=Paenibacillus harenae TaxID=306543 RepID=UPI00040BD837|nr:hypothetical protein [Paenibacillus harenae]